MNTQAILDAVTSASEAAIGECASIGFQTVVPRGAEPFVGTQRPLLIVTCRWSRVAPGAVYMGGSREAMQAVLGVVVGERAPDQTIESDDEMILEAARPITQAVGRAILILAGLPTDLTLPTIRARRTDLDIRDEIGQVPNAVALTLHSDASDVRIVVVFPSIVNARLWRERVGDEVLRERGSDLAHAAVRPTVGLEVAYRRTADDPMVDLPIDLAVELGRTKVPLAALMTATAGERLALDGAPGDAVSLTTQASTVAAGFLEIQDNGRLGLRISTLPFRQKRPA